MRINVYSQELTPEVKLISKESDGVMVTGYPCYPNGQQVPDAKRRELPTFLVEIWHKNGCPAYQDATNPWRDVREEPIIYHAAQLMLHSSSMLHHPPFDDDRSAVTFWLPKSAARREEMAKAFEKIAEAFRTAPQSGLD
jgi:hypothetical protein